MKKILNVGSMNMDHVYSVPHFVQPGETLSSTSLKHFPGGKGLNQSIALACAGGNVFHAGKTGADGPELIQKMKLSGVHTEYIECTGSSTGHTIIQVTPKGQNCILLYPGANRELTTDYLDGVFDRFEQGDILVLQNEVNHIPYMMKRAHQIGMEIAFNPSPVNSELTDYPLECVRWFLLNEIEGKAMTGKEAAADILAEMGRLYPEAAIVLTVGQDGVFYRDGSRTLSHGVYQVPVVDTTAAGDTFTGFFISSAAAGKSAEEALRLASVASSIAVSRQGASVSIPTLDEVLHSTLTQRGSGQ